jgi:hypothetical protein
MKPSRHMSPSLRGVQPAHLLKSMLFNFFNFGLKTLLFNGMYIVSLCMSIRIIWNTQNSPTSQYLLCSAREKNESSNNLTPRTHSSVLTCVYNLHERTPLKFTEYPKFLILCSRIWYGENGVKS